MIANMDVAVRHRSAETSAEILILGDMPHRLFEFSDLEGAMYDASPDRSLY